MTTGHEEEFRRLFEEEAMQRLSALAEEALELEASGPADELVASMFRNAHTLKGGAGVVGFREVGDVVHELESLIDELRSGRRPATPQFCDAVLGAVDALREMIARAIAGQDERGAAAAVRAALARADAPAQTAEVVPARPAPPPAAPEQPGPRESIAVPLGRLDDLVRLVGEGAAAQLRVGRLLAERLGSEPTAVDEYRELSRVITELQDKAMRARMVSVATLAAPLRRAARELARNAGKQVEWEVAGEDTELDRHVLEALREPLVALVRNAVDHGIEEPDERIAAGKDPVGHIRVHAMQIGGDVIIAVADDGRGVDVSAVRSVVSRGLSDAEALDAIFRPGVSTARSVTGVSGRGVGLDAVRTAVESVRGQIEVRSTAGRGSEFRLIVPMTLALLRCLVLSAGGRRYALPMPAAVALLGPAAADELSAEGRPAVWFGGDAVPVTDLAALIGAPAPPAAGPVVVVSTPAGRHALRVDAVTGQRDVVVKDLGRLVGRLPLVAGASVEADGSILLVLDPSGLLEAAAGEAGMAGAPLAVEAPAEAVEARARVLVVDDALTIRELQRSILERAGYAVVTAVGGEDALRRLGEGGIDLVLTDVEMPGMDGFELTRDIRRSAAHSGLPVVILTSRTDERDRRRGLEAGADAYLVKSTFDEHTLLTAVARLLGHDAEAGP
jgi:two-component system chemotaxis sensor kinase CheA